MADIDRISRQVPCICKVAPSSHYHMEDVSHAGGIPTIMGELDRAGLIKVLVDSVWHRLNIEAGGRWRTLPQLQERSPPAKPAS